VPGGKNIFEPPPTKTAEFEVKNGAKSRQKQKHNICCLLILIIFRSNQIDLPLKTHSGKICINYPVSMSLSG